MTTGRKRLLSRIYFGSHDAIELLVYGVLLIWLAGAVVGCIYGLLDLAGIV